MNEPHFPGGLLRAIRTAVRCDWDPIGVGDAAGALHEYDAYIGKIAEMVNRRAGEKAIFDYLWWLETDYMGLQGDRERTKAFAKRLSLLRDEYQ